MFHPWMMLSIEANQVIALRLMKLIFGGRSARREAKLMVAEKIDAAFKSILAGGSSDEIIRMYRRRVGANAKRLSKVNSSRAALRRRRLK